jgi:hypothetical protein
MTWIDALPLARAFGEEAAELVAALAIFAVASRTASGSISPFMADRAGRRAAG